MSKISKPKIFITEPEGYSSTAIKTLKSIGLVVKKIEDADILVVKLNFQVTREVIDKSPLLKLIATSTTGLNHIDIDYAEKKGIKILSLRGHADFLQNVHSTAEQTLALLLALIRKLPWSFDHLKQGQWDRKSFYGHEIFGKTLGILGYGRLGKMVGNYGRCLGLKVIAHDPYVASQQLAKDNVTAVSFNDLLRQSDIFSIHVLLTVETEKLVKEKHLRLMKPSALLINTARGEIVDEKALLKALQKKLIAGAAIDVMTDEKPDGSHLRNNALLEYAKNNNNFLITPHLGGATKEAMVATENFIAQKVKEYVKKL